MVAHGDGDSGSLSEYSENDPLSPSPWAKSGVAKAAGPKAAKPWAKSDRAMARECIIIKRILTSGENDTILYKGKSARAHRILHFFCLLGALTR